MRPFANFGFLSLIIGLAGAAVGGCGDDSTCHGAECNPLTVNDSGATAGDGDADSPVDSGSDAGDSGSDAQVHAPNCDPALAPALRDPVCSNLSPEPAPLQCAGLKAQIYRDVDGDGIGTKEGAIYICVGDALPAGYVESFGDCDESPRCGLASKPGAVEICDECDNDCNGEVNDGVHNACGGDCRAFEGGYQPGASCSNHLLGACARTGVYQCTGPTSLQCDAEYVSPGVELAQGGLDNDCDGDTDE
ncbi:MAG: MopE-related protein [Myxococcales bacterium]